MERPENNMRSGDAIIAASLLSLMLVATSHRPRAGDQFEVTRSPEVTLGQIRAGNERFWAAFAARDLWSIGRLWAKTDAVSAIFPAGSTPFVGWDNIRESFRRSFAHNRDVRVDAQVVSVRAEGTAAWLVDAVRFEAVQTQTGQPVVMDRILGTKLFERSGDGQWRLIHLHVHFPGFSIPNPTQHKPMKLEPSVQPPAHDDVARASAAFYDAFTTRDLEAMARVWAPDDDVSAIHPSTPAPFLGPGEVMKSWKQAFSDIEMVHIRPQFSIQHVSGSVAWVVDMNEFHALLAERTSPVHLHNVLSTQIFVRREGQWLMVHYHGQIGFSFDHAD
jgi:ketosteroid isomerase-like protein